jgi:hypothetical protein
MTISGWIRMGVDSAVPGSFFRASDFPGSRSAIETALSRLVSEGVLRRVHRGLYWKGVHSRFGAGRPAPLAVGVEVAGRRGVGPAGWTASHLLGLSSQVAPTAELTVVGRHAPRAPEGILFHTRTNLARLDLRFHEIALLEVLRGWPAKAESDWTQLVEAVHGMEAQGLLDLDRLQRSVRGEPPQVRHFVASLTA